METQHARDGSELFTGVVLGVTLVASATAGPTLGPVGAGSPYYEAAVRGDPTAQAMLGAQYAKTSDAQAAFQWIWRAAQQGHGGAQLELAEMFAAGRTVPKHLVTAYQWAYLAQGNAGDAETTAKADQLISQLAQQLSNAEIKDALRRAAEWKPRRELQPQGGDTKRRQSGPVLAAADTKPVIELLTPAVPVAAATASTPPASSTAAEEPDTSRPARNSTRTRSPGQMKSATSFRAYLRARLARYARR